MFVYYKPLYGRIKLKTFDYAESHLFYLRASLEEKIIFYSILGGLPFYLQKIDDTKSVKKYIILGFFSKKGYQQEVIQNQKDIFYII
ncbi:hypothetical protein [Candidatus Phytoplasma crotalariae]|nr:hypothetical protein ['Crotalaria aegyptiaca' phytoplasma]